MSSFSEEKNSLLNSEREGLANLNLGHTSLMNPVLERPSTLINVHRFRQEGITIILLLLLIVTPELFSHHLP